MIDKTPYKDALAALQTRCRSEHIEKQDPKVMHAIRMHEENILDAKHLVIIAQVADYSVKIFAGHWKWYTCTCQGFYFNLRCKHIHQILTHVQNEKPSCKAHEGKTQS